MVSLSCQAPTLKLALRVLNAGSTKVLLRFFFHCLPLALFLFSPQKRLMPKHIWACDYAHFWLQWTLQDITHPQMCLGSNKYVSGLHQTYFNRASGQA